MYGSLTHHDGVVYVGRQAKTAWVSSFDLDGRPLQTCFSFRDEASGRSSAAGLAIDDDHRLWVADQPAGVVRGFTLFGKEVVCMRDPDGDENALGGESLDRRGFLGQPVDVLTTGRDEEFVLAVASGGRRRHGLQWFHASTGRVRSLRPLGDPRGQFQDLAGLAGWAGPECDGGGTGDLLAVERGAGRIQVFREGEFHYAIDVFSALGERAEPVAADGLDSNSLVVAVAEPEHALLLVSHTSRVLRVLAREGTRAGQVTAVEDLAVVAPSERPGAAGRAQILVLDQDGTRVQVFTPQGQCYGCFPSLAGV